MELGKGFETATDAADYAQNNSLKLVRQVRE